MKKVSSVLNLCGLGIVQFKAIYIRPGSGGWWYTTLIPAVGRQRQVGVSVSLRPAWSRELVPGQPPKLQRNPV